jgi:hypothetical protein
VSLLFLPGTIVLAVWVKCVLTQGAGKSVYAGGNGRRVKIVISSPMEISGK